MEEVQKKLWRWAIGFNYFNAMDGLVTVLMTQHLNVHEAHPLMSMLLKLHPLVFFAFKIIMGLLVTRGLFKRKEVNVLKVLTFCFLAIVIWNVANSYVKYLMYGVH